MPAYRLGFLLCDHALPQLADRFGDYPDMFNQAFDVVTPHIQWRVFDVTAGQLPSKTDDCDGYLISGSRYGAYEAHSWIPPLAEFIRLVRADGQPMVGLCFGHQMIGQALGGEVRVSTRGWGIGIHQYRVKQTAAWMQPALNEFVVPVCHQDQVERLPTGAQLLAGNEHCPNFIVQYAPAIVGIQGHPEFNPDFIAELITWRRDGLPEAVYHRARESLTNPHHNHTLKHWICEFLGIETGPG